LTQAYEQAGLGAMFQDKFVKLHGDVRFFCFGCAFAVYCILAQGVITQKFLVTSLFNLSHKWSFSKSTLSLLVAFGYIVPELFVSILAFQSDNAIN